MSDFPTPQMARCHRFSTPILRVPSTAHSPVPSHPGIVRIVLASHGAPIQLRLPTQAEASMQSTG